MKKYSLNLTTFSLNQVIKFDYNIKGVVYFEAENWRDADKFANFLLHGQKIEYKRDVPEEVEKAIEIICKN